MDKVTFQRGMWSAELRMSAVGETEKNSHYLFTNIQKPAER